MLDSNTINETSSLMPPKLRMTHTDFKLVSQSDYYKTYQADYMLTDTKHLIRVLDTESDFFLKHPDTATTLFLQELFYLSIPNLEKSVGSW